MNSRNATFPFANKSLFLVWGPPSHGPRSQVFARELGISELHFLHVTSRRGAWIAPIKYALQSVWTLGLLLQKRPSLVFVQSPPGLAILVVAIYCALTGSRYIVDAHSAALQLSVWTKPRWLWAGLARKALVTIVTNEHMAHMLQGWGARALVIRDIPTTFPEGGTYPLNGDFNVTMVNTFSTDEPLEQVLEAAQGMDGVRLYVTGSIRRGNPQLLEHAPKNVTFTDFLSIEEYYALMRGSHAVMCLTTRDNTMQRGACEALSLGKPIITSHWQILRGYFHKGTVHVDNTSEGIRHGVQEMRSRYEEYVSGIRELQVSQQAEWEEKVRELESIIRSGGEA
jgi:glycosyltransferase involved in cell wall biosynthesis